MVPWLNTMAAMATVVLERGKMAKVNELHKIIGHPSKETTRKTAEYYGWKVTGKFGPCKDCGLVKSRQNNVNKDSEVRSKNPGESVFAALRATDLEIICMPAAKLIVFLHYQFFEKELQGLYNFCVIQEIGIVNYSHNQRCMGS
jgi:hypothetical protein